MRRKRTSFLYLAASALAIGSAACGGSAAITGEEPKPQPAAISPGNAAVQGTVVGASNLKVGVVGMSVAANVDEEGQFALAGLPAGTVTLQFTASGVDARVPVAGLQSGLVTSVNVEVSGSGARLTAPPTCQPTADTYFTGVIESVSDTRLLVTGRTVDVTQLKKVWRGNRRINFADLTAGEKVKVWGVLRADGSVVAEEISSLTSGDEVWADFTGTVESITAASRGVSRMCLTPKLVVSGILVHTNESTAFLHGDGSKADPSELKVGMKVQVAGWKKPDGSVRAVGIRL